MKTYLMIITLMFSPFLLANEWAEDGELFDNVSVEEVNSNNALERFNQASAKFNDTVDAYLLKPVAEGYQYITPQVVNSGVSNIFSNIAELPSMFNALLQGKPYVAADNFFRFFINSTVGLLGFFDVATAAGITEQKEDFGQTLARWGAAEGPYVVLPFFGPSTVRNMHGLMIDSVINPINQIEDVPRYVAVAGLKTVDGRADLLSSEKLITSDRYLFIKNAYLQHRHYLESDGNVVDTFDAVELDDDWLE